MGTGTLEEALAWVEYCNSARPHWVLGRPAPAQRARKAFGIRWWGLGQRDLRHWQVGALSAEEYVAEATRWARATADARPEQPSSCPAAELGWTDWDRKVIDGLAALVDLHSMHLYTGQRGLLDQRALALTRPSGR